MPKVSVLIPTWNRYEALAVTLTSLVGQSFRDFEVIISDQTPEDTRRLAVIATPLRVLAKHQIQTTYLDNSPPRGMAQQRQFLLDHAQGSYALFLDDDVLLEPFVLRELVTVLDQEKCGFAGSAVIGLSFSHDFRPDQQHIELWNTPVTPEAIRPGDQKWQRYVLHNAANILHVQEQRHADPDNPQLYKVAWVGGCVLYDTQKLQQAGGFEFWREIPEEHCGEDVMAQLKVMEEFGGCGVLPSGAYHLELPTTLPDRHLNVPEQLLT